MTLTSDHTLQNRYRIVSPLGQGGMGAVYRAWDTRLNVHMALKEMIPQPGLDPHTLAQLRQQFEQEAMVLAKLDHPHLVGVSDFFEEEGNTYLVMKFIEGENLADRVEREGTLPEAQVLAWAGQLLDALAYCHDQGVIHRDVSPQNVIIRPDGQAALVDFGLVKLWDPGDPRTKTAMRGMGKPEYAPPEQYDTTAGHTDPRSDVYSLGATVYHALTGQAPPTATMRIASRSVFQPPQSLNRRVSPTTEAAVLRAMELTVEDRFSTAQEMAAALKGKAFTSAPPKRKRTKVMPGGPLAAPPRRKRMSVWVWALGGLAVLALVGMMLWVREIKGTRQVEETVPATAVTKMVETATQVPSPLPTATLPDAVGNVWTRRGPQYSSADGEGPQIFQLGIDPFDPDVVYAGTSQGIYRSTDGGESWESRNIGLGDYGDVVVTGLVLDPTIPNTLIVGTWGYGLLRSNDGGMRWSRLADPLGDSRLSAGALDREDHPPIIAGGPSYTYQGEEGIPSSRDLSTTWQRTAVRCVALNPTNPDEILTCIDDAHGLYRSTNGGNAWSRVDLGTGSAWTYAFAPSNSQIRYASFGSWSESGGFYHTTDGGNAWTKTGVGAIDSTVIAVAIHPTNPDIVLAGTSRDGLYRSTDGGDSWVKVSDGLDDVTFYSVAFAPGDPDVVYAGGYTGIYHSADGGATWDDADSGFSTWYVRSLAIHPDQPETVLIGASHFPKGGVYKRTSSDAPFAPKIDGMQDTFVLDIEQHPGDPNILYAATWGAGIFRSTDGGLTWGENDHAAPYVYAIEAVQSQTGTILYAATFYSDWGILKSNDQGDTWSEVSREYPSYISFDVESIDESPDHLVAATLDGIQYSEDGGKTWNDTSGVKEGIVLQLCEFPHTGQLLAATSDGGIFYSQGGESWYEANTGIASSQAGRSTHAYAVACSPDTPGLAYAASPGMYRTTDYGEHWQSVNEGLPADTFRAIDIAPVTGHVFAGSDQSGVYLTSRGGSTWSAINTGLAEQQIRSVKVISRSPIQTLAGTNGQGIWNYALETHSLAFSIYLPLVSRSIPGSEGQAYEPNNSFGQARSLPAPGTLDSYVSSDSDEDYYRFDIRALGPITVGLTNIPPDTDYDLELYDGNRRLVGGSYWPSSHDERVVFQPTRTGRYYVKVYSGGGSSQSQAYRLAVSHDDSQGTGQIYGTVTDNGRPAADVPVVLYYDSGYRTTRSSTLTDRSGIYRFQGMPSLPVGHTYSIVYPNYEDSSRRLAFWVCWPLTGYEAGQELETCTFDVSDVVAESPAHEAVVKLPAVFSWRKRDVSGDGYGLRLRSADGRTLWRNDSRSDVDSYTLSNLPAGFSQDEAHRWDVLVYSEAGYGVSYHYRQITTSSTASEFKGRGAGVPNQPGGLKGSLPPLPPPE